MHLDRGRRVVDRRRECPDSDVDHDPDGECRILLDRPLHAECDHRPQPVFGLDSWIGSVDLEQHGSRRDEVPDRIAEHDQAAVLVCPLAEPAKVDGLDRAAPHHPDDTRRVAATAVRSGNDRWCVRPVGFLEDLAQRLAPGPRDESGDCDRPQPVDRAVEEDDEQQYPEPQERSGERDADVRDVVLLDMPHERCTRR